MNVSFFQERVFLNPTIYSAFPAPLTRKLNRKPTGKAGHAKRGTDGRKGGAAWQSEMVGVGWQSEITGVVE